MLTQVERIIEEEKEALVAETTKSVTLKVTDDIARKLLKAGSDPKLVAESTGLKLEDVMKLKAEM